jgi:hypothetical protein
MKTTTENNRIIGEFMELSIATREDYHSSLGHDNVDDDLKYHNSWDCLMPVITKIKTEFDNKNTDLFSGDFELWTNEIEDSIWKGNITMAYDAVIELIEALDIKTQPIRYILNEADYGSNPETVTDLGIIESNDDEQQQVKNIIEAVQSVRDELTLFKDLVPLKLILLGYTFNTVDEDEDERTWFLTVQNSNN